MSQYTIEFEAKISDQSYANVEKAIKALSKPAKIEIHPELSKDIQKDIETLNKSLKDASNVEIKPKVNTGQVKELSRAITEIDYRGMQVDMQNFQRQFKDVLHTSKEFASEFKDVEKASKELDVGTAKSQLDDLKMTLREMKADAHDLRLEEKLVRPIKDVEKINLSTKLQTLKNTLSAEADFSSEFAESLRSVEQMIDTIQVGDPAKNLQAISEELARVEAIGKNVRVNPEFLRDLERQNELTRELELNRRELEKADKFDETKRADTHDKFGRIVNEYIDLISASDELTTKSKELAVAIRDIKYDDAHGLTVLNRDINEFGQALRGLDAEKLKEIDFEQLKKADMHDNFSRMLSDYSRTIEMSESLSEASKELSDRISEIQYDDQQGLRTLNKDIAEFRDIVKEISKEELQEIKFEDTGRADLSDRFQRIIRDYGEAIEMSSVLSKESAELAERIANIRYDDTQGLKVLRRDMQELSRAASSLSKENLDALKFEEVGRADISDKFSRITKEFNTTIEASKGLSRQADELSERISSIKYDDRQGIKVLNRDIADFKRLVTSLNREEIKAFDFEFDGRANIQDKFKRMIRDYSDLVKTSSELSHESEILSKRISEIKYDDKHGIRELNRDLTEFGRILRDTDKDLAAKELFDMDGRVDMATRLTKTNEEYKHLIESSKELEQAQASLWERISSVSYDDNVAQKRLNEDLREYGRILRDLDKAQLDSAKFNVGERSDMLRNLDKLEVKFQENIRTSDEFKQRIDALRESISKLSFDDAIGRTEAKSAIKDLSFDLEQAAEGTDKFNTFLGEGVGRIDMYIARILSLRAALNQLRKAFEHVVSIDSSLTEIAMVTNQNIESVREWGKEYQSLAKDLKVSNAEMTEGAVGFVRQGLEQEEVLDRLASTTRFSKITNTEFTESVDLLTATVNGMNVDIERASDVMIHLGDSTATSGQEIAKGLSKTAGSASALGVEFEKVASWIATISAATREAPESIGSGINMILSRMARLTEKGFDEEDGTQINDVAKALDRVSDGAIGLEETLEDGTRTFRNYGDVLDDLAGIWDSLTEKEKSYVANAMAGARRQSSFIQLMNNYTESLELYEGALNSSGTTMEKYEIYLESLQAKIDEVKIALEELYTTLLDTGSLHRWAEALTKLIDLVTALVEQVGLLGLIVSGISMKAGIGAVLGQLGALLGGGLAAVNPITAVIGTVLAVAPVAIAKISQSMQDATASIEDLNMSLDETREITQDLAEVELSIDHVDFLDARGNDTMQERLEIGRQLAELYPELADAVDEEGRAYVSNLESAKERLKVDRERYELEAQRNAEATAQRIDNERKALEESLKVQKEELDVLKEREERLRAQGDTELSSRKLRVNLKNQEKLIENIREEQEALQGLTAEQQAASEILEKGFTQGQQEAAIALVEMQRETIRTAEEVDFYTKVLTDAGIKAWDAAMIVEHGQEKVREAMYLSTEAGYEYIMGLNTMSQAEKDATLSMLNQERERLRLKVKFTKGRIDAMKAELDALQTLHGGNKQISEFILNVGKDQPYNPLSFLQDTMQTEIDSSQKIIDDMETELLKTEKALARLNEMDDHVRAGITVTDVGGRGSGGSGGKGKKDKKPKSAKKKKEEYKATADAYQRINNLIEKNNNALARNSALQDIHENNIEKRLQLMKEEVALEERSQELMHTKATMLRNERSQVESQLAKSGFQFAGDGDDRFITNLEHIEGKSKEVEELFNRFIEIQLDALPELSTGWWEVQSTINDIKLEELVIHMEELNKESEIFNREMAKLDHELKMLTPIPSMTEEVDFEIQRQQINKVGEQLMLYRGEAERTEASLQALRELGQDPVIASTEEYIEVLIDAEQTWMQAIESVLDAEIDFHNRVIKMNNDWINQQNKLHDEQRARLSALESAQEDVVKIIRKRGELEKKEMDKRHKAEIDALNERKKAYEDAYKEDLDNYKDLIQAKLDALKDSWDEEDYQEQLEKEREELAKLTRDLAELTLDDTLEARAKAVQLEKKIKAQEEKIAKMQRDKERKDTEKMLKDKMKDREDFSKQEKELQDEEFEREKALLEERQQMEKDAHEEAYSNSKVYAEARIALMENQVEVAQGSFMTVEEAFVDFSMEFEKGMGIMGDIIHNDFTMKWNEAVEAMERADNVLSNLKPKYDSDYNAYDGGHLERPSIPEGSSRPHTDARPKEFESWSDADFYAYVANKKDWRDGNDASRIAASEENANLREKYWGASRRYDDNHSYESLLLAWERERQRKMAHYNTGGVIPRDGIIMAHEKEMVIPEAYQKDLWDFIQGAHGFYGQFIGEGAKTVLVPQIPITVEGNMDSEAVDALEQSVMRILERVNADAEISLQSKGVQVRRLRR